MSALQRPALPDWDLFCRIVDNYGDIGVSWRLARQLAHDFGLHVRLWVDDLQVFQRLCPAVVPGLPRQIVEGVDIRLWDSAAPAPELADVLIEAFGCGLPRHWLEALAARSPAPVWINLEYLSAEAWVGGLHGLPSPHPQLPLTRHFYFPGYRPDTGGLLREATLRQHDVVTAGRPERSAAEQVLHVSLFAYDNPALLPLLDAWADGTRAVVCHLPEGKILAPLAHWLGLPVLVPGQTYGRGTLTLRCLPFLSQDAYDDLLRACDINFVRGEDSCVRAQWAGQPYVWQAYVQPDCAHHAKLDALLQSQLACAAPALRPVLTELWQVWNGMRPATDTARCWHAATDALGAWQASTRRWRTVLWEQTDLATRLIEFVSQKKRLR